MSYFSFITIHSLQAFI